MTGEWAPSGKAVTMSRLVKAQQIAARRAGTDTSQTVMACVAETDKIFESVTPYVPTNTPQEGRHD